MPLYVYACETCGHGFEVRQRFGDDPLSVCPECSGRVRRVIQPVGIVFKGSGFYKTDSRSSSSASVPPGESSNGSGTAKPAGETAAAASSSAGPSAPSTESASTGNTAPSSAAPAKTA
jgi:putative FmdB family regulatory protein